MPFQTATDNLIRRPELVALQIDAGAETTPFAVALAEAAAEGAITIDVTAATNFTPNTPARLGAGELVEPVFMLSIAGTTVTLDRPLRLAHVIESPVVEQAVYDLGDVDGDITQNLSQESTDQQSAMRMLTFAILRGNLSLGFAFRLLGTTLANVALAHGIPWSKITGAGTAGDPRCLQTDLSDVDTLQNASLFVVSKRTNGTRVVHELWGLATDYTGVNITFARAQNGAVPVSVMGLSAFLQFDLAANTTRPWTALKTYRASAGTIFRELREVGVIEATGAVVTVTDDGGGGVAGEKAITLSGTTAALAPDDFVIFGTDDTVEIHQAGASAGALVTLKTGLLRDQLDGTPVQKGVKIPFFTITPGGVTYSTGGSTTPIQSELRELPIGMQQNGAQAKFAFATNDLLVANIARALGVPVSQVSNGGALLSKLVASRAILGAYFEGITQNGMVCRLVVWGASQEVQSFALALGSSAPAQAPYSLRPASGFQFTQWTV